MKQKKLITVIVVSSLALTGCGGGGGGGGSPSAPPANVAPTNSNALNNPPQLWAPYYSVTPVSGSSSITYGGLSVDLIANPTTHPLISNITSFDGPNAQTGLPGFDSSGMLAATGSGFTVEGIRYFFFSSGGQLYALDLTSTAQHPVAVPWGQLNVSQICGIQAEQFDGSGLTGDVIVSGVPSSSSLGCNSPSTWRVPFNTPATTAISPLPFHEFIVATFITATTSNINTTGYVIGVTTGTGTSSTVNYTTQLRNIGTAIIGIPPYNQGSDSLASDLGGDATHQFVWVYHSTSPTSSNLYSVSNTGTAAPVTLPAGNISNNTATDSYGNLYIVAISGTAAPFAVDVYKVPFDGGLAKKLTSTSISAGSGSTTSILTNISVNQSGTGGMLTVTVNGSGTPPQTNMNYVLDFNTQNVTATIVGNDGYAMQFIGLDGLAYINNNSSTQNEVDAVNLAGGNTHIISNVGVGISQLSSTNLLGLPNVNTVAYGSFWAQDSTGVVSVIGTQTYGITGHFILPTGGIFYRAALSSNPNYILGMESGTTGGLFAVVPAIPPATANSVISLGTNSNTITWKGY